jgi:ribose 5-phosphate isomerase A
MNLKQTAGERAADFVRDEMTIGLGSGSTVYWTIRRLGAMMVDDGLKIRAVPTSRKTEDLAREHGIPLVGLIAVEKLDLTIDGADEISPHLDLIKGAGGALVREKLVAAASKRLIIVADESKLVPALGAAALPVEVVPFGWETTARRIEALELRPTLRTRDGKSFVTDNGNYILDCTGATIEDPAARHRALKLLTGVVETGLFVGMAGSAVVAGAGGIEIIERSSEKL